MTDITVLTEFILMGFSTNQSTYIFHPLLFSLIYLCAFMGNVFIIIITTLDKYLHTPMYFFLKNLSFLDLCLISSIIPKSIINSLTHSNSISFFGCVAQVLLVPFSTVAELFLLTVMSFDRYAAICHPLHYDVIMNRNICLQMATSSWVGGGIIAVMHTAGTFSLLYCKSNVVHQFFCDIPHLLAISCSGNALRETVLIVISVVIDATCLILIVISYVYIFSTVKKISSTEGQSKAFSTCLPHLVVVVLFLSTAFIAYLKPTSGSPSIFDIIITIFYTCVPPTFNPLIYSLRNKAIKKALVMLLEGRFIQK